MKKFNDGSTDHNSAIHSSGISSKDLAEYGPEVTIAPVARFADEGWKKRALDVSASEGYVRRAHCDQIKCHIGII